jgi:hypothetical protein
VSEVEPPVDGQSALEPAPKPWGLWDAMQAQVDQAFEDFFCGDYAAPSDADDCGLGGPE